MAKRYRMTPRRRAALKKAQMASARKRRNARIKSGAKAVGSVAGTVLAGAAIYGAQHHLNQAAKDPLGTYKKAKGFLKRGPKVDPNSPGVQVKSRKPLKYYGRGRASHIRGAHTGMRIRSRI